MIGDRESLVHKKWIYSNNKKLVSLDHKSRPNLINGTIGYQTMFPNLLKMVQVKRLKLLRIRLWGCIIGLLVPLVMKRELKNPNHLNQWRLSKLSEGLTGPIGLMEDPR